MRPYFFILALLVGCGNANQSPHDDDSPTPPTVDIEECWVVETTEEGLLVECSDSGQKFISVQQEECWIPPGKRNKDKRCQIRSCFPVKH